jgi:hypothetical protein
VTVSWERTDNPNDPCGYCVGWRDDPDDDFGQNPVPIRPDGTPIRRLYRQPHPKCQAMVDVYLAERENDPT